MIHSTHSDKVKKAARAFAKENGVSLSVVTGTKRVPVEKRDSVHKMLVQLREHFRYMDEAWLSEDLGMKYTTFLGRLHMKPTSECNYLSNKQRENIKRLASKGYSHNATAKFAGCSAYAVRHILKQEAA